MEQEKSRQGFPDVENMDDQGNFVSKPEKNDHLDNSIDESCEPVDKYTDKYYRSGTEEAIRFNDTKDTSSDIMVMIGNIDSHLVNLQNDLQGNIGKSQDENENIVKILNIVALCQMLWRNIIEKFQAVFVRRLCRASLLSI